MLTNNELAYGLTKISERIRYLTLHFKIMFDAPAALPPYIGSTVRGAFGHAFRKVLCVCSRGSSGGCPYHSIFESALNDGALRFLRNVEKVPHPYLLEIPVGTKQYYERGDILHFTVRLFGFAVDYALNMIDVVSLMGKKGITKNRVPFRIVQVYTGSNPERMRILYDGIHKQYLSIPDTESFDCENNSFNIDTVRFHFLTPVSLVDNGKLQNKPYFSILITSLIRRIACLAYYAEGIDEVTSVTQGEKIVLENVNTEEESLVWMDTSRYSNSQKTDMKFGGMIGSVVYNGDISKWYPLLKFGELVHAGKRTTFGFGQYRLEVIR